MRFSVLEFLLVDGHLLANSSSDHKIAEKGKMENVSVGQYRT
jgi:hypothetical protein